MSADRFIQLARLPGRFLIRGALILPNLTPRMSHMASDFRLKEQLPELTERIVQTYSEVGTINHLGPLPAAELRGDHRGQRGSQGDSLSRLSPPRGAAPGQRHLSRRRADRRAARQADHADRPRPAARRRRERHVHRRSRFRGPRARPRRSSFSSSFPICASSSSSTCRRPTKATRRSRTSTK